MGESSKEESIFAIGAGNKEEREKNCWSLCVRNLRQQTIIKKGIPLLEDAFSVEQIRIAKYYFIKTIRSVLLNDPAEIV
jgi:hypothetical protein